MRLKFFFVTSAIVFVMIVVFCSSIIISTRIRNNSEAQGSLARIVNMFENFTGDSGENVRLQINDLRSFAVILDENNEIIRKPNVTYYTDEQIETYIERILNGNAPSYFLISQRDIETGKLIAWVDRSIEAKEFSNLVLTVSLLVLAVLLSCLF